jgi:hypothetical protein
MITSVTPVPPVTPQRQPDMAPGEMRATLAPAAAGRQPGQAARAELPTQAVTSALASAEASFFRHHESGHYVYRLADPNFGHVLLQSPPDQLLRLFASLREDAVAGLQLDI